MDKSDEKFQRLERLLPLSNRKQELGFVALGKVIDRAALKTAFLSIAAGLCTIIPIIFALADAKTLTTRDFRRPARRRRPRSRTSSHLHQLELQLRQPHDRLASPLTGAS